MKTRKDSFTLFTAISLVSTHLTCQHARYNMALISDAKQAKSEGKSGLVATGLNRLVDMAL